ncbi:MAG: serine-type D-Ala-D-Ala carboxypeptidase [Gammaproteobacteria bacterium RIFCSPLOWO2_12_FULL_52_10]|nr:MAG: serine-type D-Ala-D-Ala carboxypeptidase [Gammaproteobacteria bacterium RIFCSPLOWO2_12_FULL_52_10]
MLRILLFLMSIFAWLLSPVVTAVTLVPAPPRINASSYLVMDYHSGRLVVNENADKRVEPASLTKIMTVYIAAKELAAGNIHLDDKVHVSEKAWRMTGSRMFIEVNKQVTVEELLHGIIIQSGNDASVALAEYIAGDEDVFAQLMNQQAKLLGMINTNFVNSTGLPHAEHYTTANDLALLARSLIREYPEIYAMHSLKEFIYNGIKQTNRNSMLWRDESVDGIKTGHTESAGYCLVASATRGGMRLISVVMGTEGDNARINMTQVLLSYAFRFFETHKLYTANQVIQTGRIWKGDRESVDLGVNQDLYITIPKGTYKQLDASIELEPIIIAPVSVGEVKGTLKVKLEKQELVNQPLITLQSVGSGSVLGRFKDDVKLLFE